MLTLPFSSMTNPYEEQNRDQPKNPSARLHPNPEARFILGIHRTLTTRTATLATTGTQHQLVRFLRDMR